MKSKKRLVLLDTHAILHRAYHALPDFSSSRGEPTGALYGLISMLVKIIKDLKPDYLVAAYDLPGPTIRHTMFEAYKAGRVKAEDDLIVQIKRSRDVLRAFGVPGYECEGFEADDIIGTIVEKMKTDAEVDLIIASGDMDTLQLVDDARVRVFTLKKGLSETVLYDEKGVEARFGFGPRSLPDYKGLRGDPSDNIPGIKGVGEKTASLLIAQFGTLENLYAALKKEPEKVLAAGVKEGMVKKLIEGEEEAKFSKILGEIRRDAPIDFSLPRQEWREGVDTEKLFTMMAELDFRSLMPRVRELVASKKLADAGYGDFSAKKSPEVASSSLGKPPSSAVSSSPASAEEVGETELQKAALAVWVLDSNITTPELEDIYRAGQSRVFADASANVFDALKKSGLEFVYESIEVPLTPVLRRMEKRGVRIDRAFLKKLSGDYHAELDKIAARIYEAAGGEFNINSPKQLGEVLFDKLGLAARNQKKTATGARSTREEELRKLRDLHPVIEDILAHRELQKLLSTYIDTIPTLLDGSDRLHTTYVQTGTTTGRLASQNPNLQNIPIKTELGRAIRHAFVPDEGMKLVSFDYSQIELRIAALLSGDEALAEIFRQGGDVHAEVASRVFRVGQHEVSPEQRRRAKVINFGILYGMGVNALREALGTSRAEAQEFYNQYFAAFPRLAAYIDEIKGDAARLGYTETHFGRRRYFEGIKSPIPYVRAAAERMAINAPIQGTSADIIKLAMIRIDEFFEKEANGSAGRDGHLLLQVHDELLFEIREDRVGKCALVIRELMEGAIPAEQRKGIPLSVEGKAGDNWGDMKKI